MNIDGRLKENEKFKMSVSNEMMMIRESIGLAAEEASVARSSLDEKIGLLNEQLVDNQKVIDEKFDLVLSRVETHGKRKGNWWSRFRK